jgi:hypothetical protein
MPGGPKGDGGKVTPPPPPDDGGAEVPVDTGK